MCPRMMETRLRVSNLLVSSPALALVVLLCIRCILPVPPGWSFISSYSYPRPWCCVLLRSLIWSSMWSRGFIILLFLRKQFCSYKVITKSWQHKGIEQTETSARRVKAIYATEPEWTSTFVIQNCYQIQAQINRKSQNFSTHYWRWS